MPDSGNAGRRSSWGTWPPFRAEPRQSLVSRFWTVHEAHGSWVDVEPFLRTRRDPTWTVRTRTRDFSESSHSKECMAPKSDFACIRKSNTSSWTWLLEFLFLNCLKSIDLVYKTGSVQVRDVSTLNRCHNSSLHKVNPNISSRLWVELHFLLLNIQTWFHLVYKTASVQIQTS